jgi:CRP/FNR family transcriptional regulator, cyclic AMP receptor protein
MLEKEIVMRGPYGFEPNEGCQSCKASGNTFFCKMPAASLKDFDAVKTTSVYPPGAVLFLEKQDPRGIYVLCAGEVKLTMSSSSGKTLILRIAKPGEVLGLMATMTGKLSEVTAETVHPCQVIFVRREDFLRLVTKHPGVCHEVIRQLGSFYQGACDQLRTVALAGSAPEKLARILLEWSSDAKATKQGKQFTLPLTHEEIAEFIGTSRETVTRTLSEFKSRQLVAFHGSTLMVSNRAALESLSGE